MNWLEIAKVAIPAVSNIAGGFIAGEQVKSGNEDLVRYLSGAEDRARKDLAEGKARAVSVLEPFTTYADPAFAYFGETLATPEHLLTESQKIGLEDVQRRTMNNLSAAGLRGSGAGQRMVADTIRRYTADAQDVNRGRRDDAARILGTTGYGATQGIANAELGTGSNMANISYGAGGQMGRAAANTGTALGDIYANTITSTGKSAGTALGAISSKIASEEARKGRPSRYGT